MVVVSLWWEGMGIVTVCHQHLGVLHWEDYDVNIDGFFFLTLGSCWGLFFLSLLLHLALSSLICNFALHPNSLRTVHFTHARYLLIPSSLCCLEELVLSSSRTFVQLHFFNWLLLRFFFIAMGLPVPACAPFLVIPYLYSPKPHPVSPLPKVCCQTRLRSLCAMPWYMGICQKYGYTSEIWVYHGKINKDKRN